MALFGELDELVKHARVQTKLLQLILETISLQVDPEQKRSPYIIGETQIVGSIEGAVQSGLEMADSLIN